MTESASLSKDFRGALEREYRALATSVSTARERADRLRALAEQAEEQAARDERALRDVEGLLGLAPQMRLEQLDERLRGQRLREIAVEVLSEHHGHEEPLHYRQWYTLLTGLGYTVAGRDPLATFLAQVTRAPEVRRIGRRSGLYALRGPCGGTVSAAPRARAGRQRER
jgi:hypothetical protein